MGQGTVNTRKNVTKPSDKDCAILEKYRSAINHIFPEYHPILAP